MDSALFTPMALKALNTFTLLKGGGKRKSLGVPPKKFANGFVTFVPTASGYIDGCNKLTKLY